MSVNGINGINIPKGNGEVKKPTYTYVQQEEMLFENWDKLDTAGGGKKDGKVGLDDLKAIADDKNNQSKEAKMIRAMLKEQPDLLVTSGIAKKDKNGKLVNNGTDKERIEKFIESDKKKEEASKPDSQDIIGPKPKS